MFYIQLTQRDPQDFSYLGGFALDVPIVLAEHFVVVFALFVVVPLLRKIFGAFLHRVFRGEEVGDELLARLVHHAANHGLGHHLVLGSLAGGLGRRRRIRVENDLKMFVFFENFDHTISEGKRLT